MRNHHLWIQWPRPKPKRAESEAETLIGSGLVSVTKCDTRVEIIVTVDLPGRDPKQIIRQVGWLLDQMAEQWKAVGAKQGYAGAVFEVDMGAVDREEK